MKEVFCNYQESDNINEILGNFCESRPDECFPKAGTTASFPF